MIGKLTASDKVAFATNHAAHATAHSTPDMNPGNIARGYTFGVLRMNAQYMRKYDVLVRKIPQKWAKT